MAINKLCSKCRQNKPTKEHRPFCSYECWEIREKELSPKQKSNMNIRQNKSFQLALEQRESRDTDEYQGLILQMLSESKKRNKPSFNYRCHTCSIGIRDESLMHNVDGWLYCGTECLELALSDEQATINRGASCR